MGHDHDHDRELDTEVTLDLSSMEHQPPYDHQLPKHRYEKELYQLQVELGKLHKWIQDREERVVILFEGRDAAGKGGAISRFSAYLNPRAYRTVALPKPNETERGQWYFQRYITHLPTEGELVFFDRSWYNRAGVEVVMGFCTNEQYREFFRQVPGLERSLAQSGIHVFKLWFTVSQERQTHRFEKRRDDPLKSWKISPMDDAAMKRYDDYSRARDVMLFHTDTPEAPWTVVNSNEKKRARLEAIRHVVSSLDYEGKDHDVAHAPDARVVQPARNVTQALPPQM